MRHLAILLSFCVLACHSTNHAPDAGESVFTPSTATPTPLQLLTLTTDLDLSSSTVTANLSGTSLEVYKAGANEIVVAIPDIAPMPVSLSLSVDQRQTPSIELTLQDIPNVPANPAADFSARITAATNHFDALEQADPSSSIEAAIVSSRQNLNTAQTQFNSLSSADQELVARFLAANDPASDETSALRPSFSLPTFSDDALRFINVTAKIVGMGAAVALIPEVGAVAIVCAVGLAIAAKMPTLVDAGVNLAAEHGLLPPDTLLTINGLINVELSPQPSSFPDAGSTDGGIQQGSLHFDSGVANSVALTGPFRTIDASDSTSSVSVVRNAALAYGEVVMALDTAMLQSSYQAPQIGDGASATELADGQFIEASTDGSSGVTVTKSTQEDQGISVVVRGPGGCQHFMLDLTYNDQIAAKQVVSAPAQVDCNIVVADAGFPDGP